MMKDNCIPLDRIKASLLPLVGVGFSLRLLRAKDLRTTLTWRNREDIRNQFIQSDSISWDRHLAWWEEYRTKNDDFVFVIEETEKLKRPVGQASVYHIDLEKSEAEYGRLMIGDDEARGRGIAGGATDLLIAWSFDSLRLKRIYIEVFKDNANALKLYHRCGFISYGNRGKVLLMDISKKPAGYSKL